jgi:phosphatidate cytidylyltransferase
VDANLRSRVATASVGIPLLIWIIGWSPPQVFAGFFFLVTIAALREYFAIALPHRWQQQLGGIAFGTLLAWLSFISGQTNPAVFLGALLMLGLLVCLLFRERLADRLTWLPRTLLGGLYVGYLVPFFVLLFQEPDGRAWVFWLFLVIMAGDTAAYFVGHRFGTKKLAPAISPGKTVEGAGGYLAGAMIGGALGAVLLFQRFSWLEILALAVTLAILGQLGDLFESWLKRVFAVKDSGSILPGHGGLLDRLDSLIFPAVFTTTYLRFFHP